MLNIEHILNCTPHDIHIVDRRSASFNPAIRKWVSEEPIILKSIPSSGMLSVEFEEEDDSPILDVPVKLKRLKSFDPLPEIPELEAIYIVSAIYATAVRSPLCYTVIDPVFTPDGKTVIGCLGIGSMIF